MYSDSVHVYYVCISVLSGCSQVLGCLVGALDETT